jgi:hypothetical protein
MYSDKLARSPDRTSNEAESKETTEIRLYFRL